MGRKTRPLNRAEVLAVEAVKALLLLDNIEYERAKMNTRYEAALADDTDQIDADAAEMDRRHAALLEGQLRLLAGAARQDRHDRLEVSTEWLQEAARGRVVSVGTANGRTLAVEVTR